MYMSSCPIAVLSPLNSNNEHVNCTCTIYVLPLCSVNVCLCNIHYSIHVNKKAFDSKVTGTFHDKNSSIDLKVNVFHSSHYQKQWFNCQTDGKPYPTKIVHIHVHGPWQPISILRPKKHYRERIVFNIKWIWATLYHVKLTEAKKRFFKNCQLSTYSTLNKINLFSKSWQIIHFTNFHICKQ